LRQASCCDVFEQNEYCKFAWVVWSSKDFSVAQLMLVNHIFFNRRFEVKPFREIETGLGWLVLLTALDGKTA